ncbi:DUF2959 domain-containing protein [Oceanidesulfovibrio marinus]|uniref:DUF2959 domain-containing protein n=1 Tax=Oceanidesulfovibrio marinus TaxID=370038 RepID=A0ABX6NH57_9BACT|nr:DUF2959 domain-containing protein [Oceanidesulfovibrio marinus]QJT09963.1 DUF2959 domain-containing protein [Oceanidesulfovibrio marinus]
MLQRTVPALRYDGPSWRILVILLVLSCVAGCQSVYYDAMEQFGVHKREILVDRVESARDSQEEAKQEFADALEQFRSVVAFHGGELEQRYETLRATLERVEGRADDVTKRINSVENVAEALFAEWEGELDQYTSAELRSRSASKLRETRARYDQLIRAMRRAEASMQPVLRTLRDQVLFLKHNLNAQAIASLQSELDVVQRDVDSLIREMERAIDEANSFINQMVSR